MAATTTQPVSRSEIARERRRQMQVRKALEAALAPGAPRAGAAFYLAVGDYLRWSMDRLHRQDQLIHDYLGQRIPPADSEAHDRLATLNRRQAASRDLMARFAEALARLRATGEPGLPGFEEHARGFVATFTSMLLPRKNPFFRHTDQLFNDQDWVEIAGATPASIADEQRLFSAVQDTAPPGLNPDNFTGEHLPG